MKKGWRAEGVISSHGEMTLGLRGSTMVTDSAGEWESWYLVFTLRSSYLSSKGQNLFMKLRLAGRSAGLCVKEVIETCHLCKYVE